ncbi:hypothetical protein P608_18560 [Comamonas thiooxydans]|uniref:Uncharacterized protein n=1 Tax=Comamonas thiooxydans TaxID=363952 RepID=A0A0E3BQL0_9BURK|nr:hypothetical protein [Comamonas thiooxydans]KGH08223.1 hypothetical protein P608_18560 [Comamonas thiooxydans]KGH14389.1 hypothetical protein P607_22990 [Comamonas thiooxydans]
MGQILIAYHGCDITTRDGLVAGLLKPQPSSNEFDWLYNGFYFFEGDSARALKLATASCTRPQHKLTRRPIATPAVVGAIIEIDRLFDLTTQSGIENFSLAAEIMVKAYEVDGEDPPKNKPSFEGDTENLHRAFDREACKMVHALRSHANTEAIAHAAKLSQSLTLNVSGSTQLTPQNMRELEIATLEIVNTAPFQASRGAFEQGKQVDPSSAIFDDTHLQLAVHDLSCIKGWFLRPGDKLMTSAEAEVAKKAMDAAKKLRTDSKPRKRAP